MRSFILDTAKGYADLMARDERQSTADADAALDALEHIVLAGPPSSDPAIREAERAAQAAIALKLIEGIGDDDAVRRCDREAIKAVCDFLKSMVGQNPLH